MRRKQRRKRWQQLTALMLCMLLIITSMPYAAFAETAQNTASASAETTEAAEAEPVEIESLREETVKHFRNADGSFTAVNYMVPVHYQEEGTDEWKEIDNTLSVLETKEDGENVTKYIPQDSPIDVQM